MSRTVSTRVGLYFGVLQFIFGLTWVEYTIYLPQLVARAGIGGNAASWILVLDQLVFALCDWAVGIAVDRVAKVVGRVSKIVAAVTMISALAFLLLPFAARANAAVFIVLIAIWVVTSSALRAPPLALLGRYTPVARQPWVSALFVIGVGIATALAPFLATRITAYDPRVIFGASAFLVAVATLSIGWAEKTLVRAAPPESAAPTQVRFATLLAFLAAVLLLQLGFQAHWFVNAPPFFEKFARPAVVPLLLSVFWIGFTFLMPVASLLAARFGSVLCMAVAAFVGAGAAWAAAQSTNVISLGIAHFVCGGAWGAIMSTTVLTAFAIGRRGSAGTAVGAFFSLVAVATMTRIALVTVHGNKVRVVESALPWLPMVFWLVAGLVLLPVMRRMARRA